VATDNRAQIEQWNGPVGERWAANHVALDASLLPISEALLARAAVGPTERVLDAGCGCGTTTMRLRALAASVQGVDISAPMLAVARARAAGDDVAFTLADASTHTFDTRFDLIFSRFGVMFFADPAAGFGHLRAQLAPGGRMVFACWRAVADNAWATAPRAIAGELVPPEAPAPPEAPGPFALADRARLDGILAAAGFARRAIEPLDSVVVFGQTAEQAADHAMRMGPLGRAAADLPESTRAQIRARLIPGLARYAGPQGFAPPAAVWLVDARPA
jgi:SAM-dependent methyltransferase